LYADLYRKGQTDSIAIWCAIKNVKKHPFFKRNSTKKNNKPQSIVRVLSDASGISYNTINKHIPFLLELGLIKFDNKKVWCVSVAATTDIALKLGLYQEASRVKRIVFRLSNAITLSDIKIIVKDSIIITHKIAAVNKCLLFKETNVTTKSAIDNGDFNFITDKRNKNRIAKMNKGRIAAKFIPKDDLDSIIPYCGISNQGFSNVNGTKSISAGFRAKNKLVRLGFIQERRKQLIIKEKVSYSEFMEMRVSCDHEKPLRYYKGTVYVDMPSEVISVNTKVPRYENCYFSNALKNIVSIPALNKGKDTSFFDKKEYANTKIEKVEIKIEKENKHVQLPYSPFVGYYLKDETLSDKPDFYSSSRFKKAWYMKNQNKKGVINHLLSRKDIKNRFGWSSKMVDLFLKKREADKVAIGTNNRSYKLYALSTITAMEQSSEFLDNLSKHYKVMENWYVKNTAKVS
jgi:nicotinamide mononucleotide adenylyltransferase